MQELVSTVSRDGVIDQYIEPDLRITCSPEVSKNFYMYLSSQKNQMRKLQVKKKGCVQEQKLNFETKMDFYF